MTGRVFVLDFPRPDDWINSNSREHRFAIARLTATWRKATAEYARAAGIPRLEAASILVQPCWTKVNRNRDTTNIAPTWKACCDGLTDAGVWDDDDERHVRSVTFAPGPKATGLARLRLTITELDPKETP